jgi:hypothetical protein
MLRNTQKFVLQEEAVEATKQKEEKRKRLEPEEQEGMPQGQHCPPAKRRGDRNPKYHEEQQKDVARIHVAHPPKTPKRNRSRSTNEMLIS